MGQALSVKKRLGAGSVASGPSVSSTVKGGPPPLPLQWIREKIKQDVYEGLLRCRWPSAWEVWVTGLVIE